VDDVVGFVVFICCFPASEVVEFDLADCWVLEFVCKGVSYFAVKFAYVF